MGRFLILLLIVVHKPLSGQYLSKQSLITDLTFLNDAIIHGHPVNYDPQKLTSITSVISLAKQSLPDSLTPLQYSLWIERGVYFIGCVHTSVQKNPLTTGQKALSYIPLTARISDNKLIITSCSDSSKVGHIIESINGITAGQIIEYYSEYKASDGVSRAYAKEYFHFASSKLISNALGSTDLFIIKTINDTFSLSGSATIQMREIQHDSLNRILNNKENNLRIIDNYPILSVRSFEKSDVKFFKEVFSEINQLNSAMLIIDLRQNTGGNRDAAIELTKHLVDTSFSYSILQPQLNTKQYLNTQGKRYLLLSKLKYNVGNVFKGKKTANGREFTYTYRHQSQNNYNGQVYVITDGFTASSSTMVTSWLKQYTNAIFLGEQASGGYNGNNGGTFPLITLPESKIEIKFPAYRLILDAESSQNTGIIPELPIDPYLPITEILQQIK